MNLSSLLKPRSHYWFWKTFFGNIRYLLKTNAPSDVLLGYVKGRLLNNHSKRPYLEAHREFQNPLQSLRLSNDWFSGHAAHWLTVFDAYGLAMATNLRVLEIGSWEGLSSFFILQTLPYAQLTSVDTWEGADEHRSGVAATDEVLSKIESAFDANVSKYRDRVTKYKGTSFSYFNNTKAGSVFDLIYVDGSHHCDDVIVDAIKCFGLLKVGGIMIFDDYLWKYYPRAIENPAAAINAFLRLHKGSYKLVRLYSQIIIEKTCDRH